MASRNLLEIRISGDNATPDKLRSRDIGELISHFESMLAAIIAQDYPKLGIDPSDVIIGLADIKHDSYDLFFQSQFENEMLQAGQKAGLSITTGEYYGLPKKSIEAIEEVRKLSRKLSTDIEIWQHNGQRVQLATINTNTQINVEIQTVTGKTTLYGTLTSVGGIKPPRARIQLISGGSFLCNITERGQLQIARQLGQRLYTEVGVFGTARWDIRDMSLQYFLIERVTEYSKKSMNEALQSLYNVAGKYYEDVEDIEQLVSEIRGTDEDDI